MAKKQVVPPPPPEVMAGVMYLAQAAESRVRIQLLRKLGADLDLLRKDEVRLRRSKKRTASVDLAVIAGQILGLKQAMAAILNMEGSIDRATNS